MVNKELSKGVGASVVIGGMLALVLSVGLIEGGLWAAAGIGGAVLAALFVWRDGKAFPWPPRGVMLALGGFALCGGVSAAASVDPKLAFSTLMKAMTYTLPLALLASPCLIDAGRRATPFFPKLSGFLVLGLAALLALLVAFTALYGDESAAVTKLNRGLSYACGLLWPLAGVLFSVKERSGKLYQPVDKKTHEPSYRHREEAKADVAIQPPRFKQKDLPTLSSFGKAGWIATLPRIKCGVARNDAVGQFLQALVLSLAALCLLVVILLLTHSRATLLGVVAGGAAALVMARWPRLALGGIAAGIAAALAWPFLINQGFLHAHDLLYKASGSWLHRIEIWDYLSYRIIERPWLGWGMGATKLLDWTIPHGAMYWANAFPVSHPHNVFVQLWVELGALGAAYAAAICALLLRAVRLLPPDLRPWGAGALTYFLAVSLCAYNLWTDSLWAALSLTAFLFAVRARAQN